MAARGEDTKERILKSAQTLVLERGFSATSLDNIIQATGVTTRFRTTPIRLSFSS
jgi:AcrR family transcriptional regulator